MTATSDFTWRDQLPKALPLTQREAECFYYLLRGKTAKQISKELTITSKTVETHLANIKKKLGVHTRADMYDFALQKNLLHIAPF